MYKKRQQNLDAPGVQLVEIITMGPWSLSEKDPACLGLFADYFSVWITHSLNCPR